MAGEIFGGYEYTLWYIEESTPGTTPTSPAFIELGVVKNVKLKPGSEREQHTGIGNTTAVATSYTMTKPSMTFTMENTDVAAVLALLILSATEKHFTFVAKKGTSDYQYINGGALNKVKFAGGVDDPIVKIDFEVLGMQELHATSDPFTTPDYATNAWTAVAPALYSDTSITKSGAWTNDDALTHATKWDFEIDYSVEQRIHLDGNKYPRRVQRKGYTVEGTMSLDFENALELDALLAEEEGVIAIPVDASNTATLSGVTYGDIESDIEELELIEFEIPFSARTVAIA